MAIKLVQFAQTPSGSGSRAQNVFANSPRTNYSTSLIVRGKALCSIKVRSELLCMKYYHADCRSGGGEASGRAMMKRRWPRFLAFFSKTRNARPVPASIVVGLLVSAAEKKGKLSSVAVVGRLGNRNPVPPQADTGGPCTAELRY